MRRARLGWWRGMLAVGAISAIGCGTESAAGPAAPDPTASGPVAPSPTPLADDPGSVVGPPAATGFPCDVRAVLQSSCANCHAGHLYYGPNFYSRDDLFRPATDLFLVQSQPVKQGTFGEHMAVVLRDGTMPPYGATVLPSDADRQLVIGWIAAGLPAGDCGALTPTP